MTAISIMIAAAEWIGTAAFAISGAITAIDRELDIFGVMFIGCVTATGGGMIRDIILNKCPPGVFTNPVMLVLSILCALIIFIFADSAQSIFNRTRAHIEYVNNIFDAIGLSAFSIVGAQIAISEGYADNVFLVVLLGMTTGVGGGILRDVLTHTTPAIFVKHIYALASIAGACVYYILYPILDINPGISAASAMFIVFAIRMLATRYQWQLPKVHLNK